MLISCIVKGCSSIQNPNNNNNNNNNNNPPQIVFHRLPWNNIQLRTEWVKLAGYNPYKADDVKHITKDHTICSLHFASNKRGMCIKHVVPTLNLPKVVTEKWMKSIPKEHKPNNMTRQTKIGNMSAPLRNSVNKRRYTSKQQISLLEDHICRSSKRAKGEFHSNSNILEEEPSIAPTRRSVVAKTQLFHPAKPVESPPPPRTVPAQAPFATCNPALSQVIPPRQKRVLVVSNYQQSVMTHLSSLWKAGKLCDAMISNGTASIKIHKVVLSAVSPKMLRIFDDEFPTKFQNVTLPATLSKEALMAFTEYLYNGVLDLDASILGQVKTIAQMLGMNEFEQLCDEQLKLASITDEYNSGLELVAVDLKQEDCHSNNAEDLNFDLGGVVDEYSFAINNGGTTHVKKETGINKIRIKVEQEDPENQNCASAAFHYGANNDVFLPDFSSHDRNFSLVPPQDVQPNVSASYLPSLSFSSKQPSTLWPAAALYQNVSEPMMRPVGYITPTSEQRLITKEMVNMVGMNTYGDLAVDDNTGPLKIEEVPIVTVKKEYNT